MHLCFAVGIASHIVSVATVPIAGKSGLDSFHLHLSLKPQKADFDPGPNGLGSSAHRSIGERDGISARSPEDVVPVEECKRGLRAVPIFDEALYRRYAGEGEGEGEGEEESGSESDSDEDSNGDTGGNDNADEDAENIQVASNSPRQDCILTQMGLFPMPNFGLCESLSDTPPTPDPAPPVTPVPAPVTPEPQPVPAPAPAPAHKPVPVNAGGPARAIPKRAIENPVLGGVLA